MKFINPALTLCLIFLFAKMSCWAMYINFVQGYSCEKICQKSYHRCKDVNIKRITGATLAGLVPKALRLLRRPDKDTQMSISKKNAMESLHFAT